MEYAVIGLLGMLLVALLVVIIDSFFLHVGAKLAGVRASSFFKAVKASIACALSTLLLALVFSWVPVGGTAVGFLIGLLLTIAVLKGVYSTTFEKAFLLWLFNVAAQAAAVLLGVFLITGAASVIF
ncbi:hypothetical protein CSA37_01850 [Candidatus Fermentibacteria bacterium]|nr:MAG: hypothetical protein CSA37_01850 [Candidatus Fermentibacteria bacterium]